MNFIFQQRLVFKNP